MIECVVQWFDDTRCVWVKDHKSQTDGHTVGNI